MTMKIRVTNESTGTHYQAKVRVYNCAKQASEELKEKSEQANLERTLNVGESAEFWLHGHQHISVEEIDETVKVSS